MDQTIFLVPRIIKPKKFNWFFLYALGLALSFMNKIRHSLAGYKTPRPFSIAEIDRSIDYCLDVVNNWEKVLKYYTKDERPFYDKHVLEIGPGADLGTGLILLSLGAKSYCAFDKNELVSRTPKEFYNRLFEKIRCFPEYKSAKKIIEEFHETGSDRFSYLYDKNFNLDVLQSNKYDILVSQAALEHLDDIQNAFSIIRNKLSHDGVMINEVDLSTHTRLIRDLDPLNILRYSDTIYNILRFIGSPNRLRMCDYYLILNQLGFKNIKTFPIINLDLNYTRWASKHLTHKFKNYPPHELNILSFYLLASMNLKAG
jgi:SAM-dependent methyltransferase